MSRASGELTAGAVGKAHGLDGSFYVTRPVASMLAMGSRVNVDGRSVEIIRRAGTDANPIIRITGCDTREKAERLRKCPITVEREAAPKLGENEWYPEDLEGLKVIDGGREIGEVVRMVALPSCEVLEVARTEGEVLLVPLVRDAVRSVDLDLGTVDVNLEFLGEGE